MATVHNPIVFVPGLRVHVEEHWQTKLAAKLPNARVVPLGRPKRDLAGRVADLQQVISEADAPVTIVAHSAGVLITVHWAAQHDLPVRGALLATPPDGVSALGPEYPSWEELEANGFFSRGQLLAFEGRRNRLGVTPAIPVTKRIL